MFGTDRTNASKNGTVTLIGSGVRVTGNIAFSGYLRVQGEVIGDITCDSDSAGTTVVHGAGSVVGTITSPHIVVGGRVLGALKASGSIEIHDGARVVGDARYHRLSIEPGGVIEGTLTPAAPDGERPGQERRIAASDTPEIEALDLPVAHDRRAADRLRRKRPIAAIAAVAIVAVGAGVWLRYGPRSATPLPAVAERTPEAAVPAVQPAPPPAVVASIDPPPVAEPPKVDRAKAENSKADMSKIVTVQGTDPEKAAGVIFVKPREPVVLFVKPRNGADDGRRIEVPARTTKRYPIAENELLRVGQGQDVEIYYQGRKLSRSMIESGQWISFVPTLPGAGSHE